MKNCRLLPVLLLVFFCFPAMAVEAADSISGEVASLSSKEPYDIGSAIFKMAVVLVVLGVGGVLLVRSRNGKQLDMAQGAIPMAQLLYKKPIGFGIVMTVVEVDSQRFMIVQDKRGHSVTSLGGSPANEMHTNRDDV